MFCQKLVSSGHIFKLLRYNNVLENRYIHQKILSEPYKRTGLDSPLGENRKFNLRPLTTKCVDSRDIFNEGMDELHSNYPLVVNDLTSFELYGGIPGLKERFTGMLNYNINLEQLYVSTSLTLLHFYKMLEKSENITPESTRLACILAWCMKMLEASLNVTDDIVDNSTIRYDKLSWFKKDDVGVNDAVLDGYFFENGAYHLIRKHLSTHSQCVNITNLLQSNFFKAIIAQHVSSRRLPLDKFESSVSFSLQRADIFGNPVRSAMYLANIDDREIHRQVADYCKEVGRFFCIQNDYMDVFGDNAKKDMADIRTGKCTWLAAYALGKSNIAQRKLMEEHYGKDDEDSIKKIVNLFQEINLKTEYERLNKVYYDNISTKIQNMPKDLPREPFQNLLNKLSLVKWAM